MIAQQWSKWQEACEDEMRSLFKRTVLGFTQVMIVTATITLIASKVLNYSFTTACINFISCNKANSLFPRATFVQKVSYMLGSTTDSLNIHVTQLRHEGLKTMSLAWDISEASAIMHSRRFGDTHTWVILLATTDIEPCIYPTRF